MVFIYSFLLLFFSSCHSQPEEKEADYHDMAAEEPAEWTTGQEEHIAGDLVPVPQEVIIREPAEVIR